MEVNNESLQYPVNRTRRMINRSLSYDVKSGRRIILGSTSMSYFSLESLALLIGLTASLLILPLVLPPLPPPPLMLLMVPIGIFAVLMILAFMRPTNSIARQLPHTTYMSSSSSSS